MVENDAFVSEKQIAKEILLALIEKDAITFYADHTDESDAKNIKNATDAFSEILKVVSN